MAFLHTIIRTSSRDISHSLKNIKYLVNSINRESRPSFIISNWNRNFHNGPRTFQKEVCVIIHIIIFILL